MPKSKKLSTNQSNFLLYTDSDGQVKVEVFIKDETVWLTQKAMAELFGVKVPAINKHLKNIFSKNELHKSSVCANFAHTAEDGKEYKTKFYSLEAVIAVGYRVNSERVPSSGMGELWVVLFINGKKVERKCPRG